MLAMNQAASSSNEVGRMEFLSASASVVSTGMVVGSVVGLAHAAGSGRGAVGAVRDVSKQQQAELMAILD
jgi:hypothetical protein